MNRTSAERQPDTLGDTLGPHASVNSLKTLEAGTGIEPVFTDLQSRSKVMKNKALVFQNTPGQTMNTSGMFQAPL